MTEFLDEICVRSHSLNRVLYHICCMDYNSCQSDIVLSCDVNVQYTIPSDLIESFESQIYNSREGFDTDSVVKSSCDGYNANFL
jgi:hypothetical protein